MRTVLTGELAQAQSYTSDYYAKLEVQNASGTWIDVGAALGSHWIVNVTWGETVDTVVSQATMTLVQRVGTASLAPLLSSSVLNVDDADAYAPLLEIGRLVRLSTATMAFAVSLDTAKYREVFTGRVDDVSGMDGPDLRGPITLTCSDLGGWLMDMQIETADVSYGSDAGVALETVLQSVLDNNVPSGEPTVTLVKESSSSFAVLPFKQPAVKVMEALTAFVLDSTGEDIRYRYDASHVSQLMWFNPDRSRITVDATFSPDQYVLKSLARALANVRNAIRMPYTDATTGTSGYVTSENLGSIDKYRRRFNGMNSSALITTQAQAQTVADAVANDLGDAPAQVSAALPFFWPVQLYDRYTFQANGTQYDSDQTFAVVGYQHTIENGKGETTLTMTGRVVGAYAAWLKRLSAMGVVLQSLSILRIESTESADGTLRNFTLIVGPRVDVVHVHYRTVTVDETEDTHDFSDTAVLPADPASPLLERPVGRIVTFSLPQPQRGFVLAARFVPYYGNIEGTSVPVTIDAAPPAINATTHATKVGALASLSIDIAFGVSDGPVTVAVIERLLGVPTTLLTLGLSAPGTVDWTTHPELADRPIPSDADSLSWTVQITDVSGQDWLFGPTVALPSVVNIKAVPSETTTTGTVTVTITDTGSYLDPTHVDGSVTSCISWHVTRLSVTTVIASTTAPGSGTSGTYTLTETLEPLHLIRVTGYVHYVDGSTESFGSWAFDPNKIADVVNATVANQSGVATVTIVWDTDALIGANCARYSLDGGSTWTSTVAISSGYLSQFTVAQSNVKQTVILQAKNAVDGGATYGNPTTVEVSALEVGTVYTECRAVVSAVSATQITVTVSGNVLTGTPTVGLVGLTGSASLASGHASGTYTYAVNGTDNVWVFNRAAMLSDRTVAGPGQAQFRSITTGAQSDDDFVTIPAQGVDTTFLAMRARVTASTATTATVRVAVADPYPQGAGSVTITYTETGGTGTACTPSSGGTVTPAATLTEAAGTYIDYTVTRPAFSTGTRRVTFTATASNRVSDSDAVDIPAVERDTVPLAMKIVRGSTSGNNISVTAAVADPYPQASGNVTVAAVATGGASVTPSSTTIACTSTTTDVDTTGTASFTITRGSTPGRVTFKASAASRIQITDALDVEQDPTTIGGGSGSLLQGTYGTCTNAINTYANPGIVDFGFPHTGFDASVAYNIYVSDPGRYGDALYHITATTGAGATTYTYTSGESLSTSITPTVDIGFFAEATVSGTNGPRSTPVVTTYGSP